MNKPRSIKEIRAHAARQARALFPDAKSETLAEELAPILNDAIAAARRRHKRNVPKRLAFIKARADEAIRLGLANLKKRKPTFH